MTVGESFTCDITSSFNCSQIDVSVDYDDGNTETLTNYQSNSKPWFLIIIGYSLTNHVSCQGGGLGIPVSNSAQPSYTTAPSTDYLCLNTELSQDDYVTAIEFFMAIEGEVTLKVGLVFGPDSLQSKKRNAKDSDFT